MADENLEDLNKANNEEKTDTTTGTDTTKQTPVDDDPPIKDKPSYFDTGYSLSEQALRRMGYFIAIEHPTFPYDRFKEALQQHTQTEQAIIEEITINASAEIKRYNDKIAGAHLRQNKIEEELTAYKTEIESEAAEKERLEKAVADAKEKIYQFFRDLATAKKTILDKRIKETNDNLQLLIDGQRKILDNDKLPFKGYLQNGENLARDIVNRYDLLAKNVNKRLSDIQKTLLCFDLKGMSPTALNFLISTGFTAALVAGWFFANFTLLSTDNANNNWLNSGLLSNVISACLEFARVHNKWKCLQYLGWFLLMVTALSFVADLFKWWYRKLMNERLRSYKSIKDGKNKSQFNLKGALSEMDGLPFSFEIESETMFLFWLEIIPLVFIAGVFMIILSYNTSVTALTAAPGTAAPSGGVAGQLISFTSEIAGFMMALALGAIYYAYLSRKGCNNCDDKNDDGTAKTTQENKRWYQKDWEFIFVIAFVALTNLLVFGLAAVLSIWNYGLNAHALGAITLIQFLLYANVAGLCIGLGTYGKGLLSNAAWLEHQLDTTNTKAKFFYQNSLSIFFTNDFGAKYKRLQEEILDLLGKRLNPQWAEAGKSESAGGTKKNNTGTANNTQRESFYKRLLLLLEDLKYLLTGRKKNQQQHDNTIDTVLTWEMTAEDVAFYPELASELESYNKERKNFELLLAELQNRWDGFYHKSSLRYIKLADELSLITSQIDNWYWRIRQIKDNLPLRIKKIRDEGLQERTTLQDGYDLGIWYRENEIGPAPGYYETKGRNNLTKTQA